MLHEFITAYRDPIIARAREKVSGRFWPLASKRELEHGVPFFLTELSEALRPETTPTPVSKKAGDVSEVGHGQDWRVVGFSISQVVYDYDDICQAITEIAVEQQLPLTAEESHSLKRCIDAATTEAATEHVRIRDESRSAEESTKSGQLAHEVRDVLSTACLAFDTLKQGTVGINGGTGAVLGRSLVRLCELIDGALSDIRLSADIKRSERIPIGAFLSEIAVAGNLHAEYRSLQFAVDAVDPQLAVNADPQLLASAVMSLLNNAFKFTHAGGRVALRALREDRRVRIEVEDECGGIPDGTEDPFKTFADRRGHDRPGLGTGLAIARKAVRLHGGDVHFRNLPGRGCVFVIEMPVGAGDTPVQGAIG